MYKQRIILLQLLLIMSFTSITSSNAFSIDTTISVSICNQISPKIDALSENLDLLYPVGYHNLSQVYEELEWFNQSVPDLIDYSSIGNSYFNNTIPLITLTNEKIPTSTKGKTFIVAHHHAREYITIENTLRLIRDLVNEYGEDETTTTIFDKMIIYIIVTLNPDALNIALYDNEFQRKTASPSDEDGDGLYDEDPPEDMNGDGRISQYADWNSSGEYWMFSYEGYDNDGDGLQAEDRIGGVDLNRNYPFHWNDNTTDGGWGDDLSSFTYQGSSPLSEPESLALTEFVSKHYFTQSLSLHSGTNASLLGWSYSNKSQSEGALYTNMLYMFELQKLLPESFFVKENYIDYTCAGEWGDWMYSNRHSIPMTLEIYHMAGSENYFPIGYNKYELKTMREYFTPPPEKIDDLHDDLFEFEKYWIGLTPIITFIGYENRSISSDEYQIGVKIKTSSQFFNTTDNPKISVNPSSEGVVTLVQRSVPTLLRNSETLVPIRISKVIPEDFYMDVNITSEWASDLFLRIYVNSTPSKVSSAPNQLLTITGLITVLLLSKLGMKRNRSK